MGGPEKAEYKKLSHNQLFTIVHTVARNSLRLRALQHLFVAVQIVDSYAKARLRWNNGMKITTRGSDGVTAFTTTRAALDGASSFVRSFCNRWSWLLCLPVLIERPRVVRFLTECGSQQVLAKGHCVESYAESFGHPSLALGRPK
jgi:hypothetical protein